jgi:hypothetical protein
MSESVMTDPRYPIGKFNYEGKLSDAQKQQFLKDIEQLPERMAAAVHGLAAAQLDTPYRDGGWTVRQVVHHVPDSHMNAFIRFKLALTEDEPTIKPYAEDRWANLGDVAATPVETSLCLLDCLHARWMHVLRSMTPEQWKRTFRHPERGVMTLEETLAMYAWHSKHHVAHVTRLRESKGW